VELEQKWGAQGGMCTGEEEFPRVFAGSDWGCHSFAAQVAVCFDGGSGGACLTRIPGIGFPSHQNHSGMTPGGEYLWSLAFTQCTAITTMSQHSAAPGKAFCSSTPHIGIGNPAEWDAEGCRRISGMSWDTEGYCGKKSAMANMGR